MKKILLIISMLLPFTWAAAQENTQDIYLKVVKNNGKPAGNSKVAAFIKSETPIIYYLDSKGETVIKEAKAGDVLSVIINSSVYEFNTNRMSKLELTLNRKGNIKKAVVNGNQIDRSGYTIVALSTYPYYFDVFQLDENTDRYLDLADYLFGRISGLEIDGGPGHYRVLLHGRVPLIVVDGVQVRDFNAANLLVRPDAIESVTVDKQGTMYGARGANGVLIITTRKQ